MAGYWETFAFTITNEVTM